MMQDDEGFATEEKMDDISLLAAAVTPATSQSQEPLQRQPEIVSSINANVVNEYDQNENTASSSSISDHVRTGLENQQSVPITLRSKQTMTNTTQSSRSLRWYQQLNVIHSHMDGSVCYRPTSSGFDSMISIVTHHYEQQQLQFRTLFGVLREAISISDTTDDDNDNTNKTTADAVQQEILPCDLNNRNTITTNSAAASVAPTTTTTTSDESIVTQQQQALDPLSVLVQEEDAKLNRERMIHDNYQRERLLNHQKRQQQQYVPDEPQDPNDPSYIITNAKAYMQLIQKDLYRLASPHFSNAEMTVSSSSLSVSSVVAIKNKNNIISLPQQQQETRTRQLQSILYLFAISHPNAGYIQGMHEIASFCLYVVETDHFVVETSVATSTIDGDSNNIEALAYWLTEQILTSLYVAYDVTTMVQSTPTEIMPSYPTNTNNRAKTQPNNNQLFQMSNRIVQCFITIDPSMYTIFQQSSSAIPYQLIFTKWIRLLFGREVSATTTTTPAMDQRPNNNINTRDSSSSRTVSHADTVIYLWEVLLDASYRIAQRLQPNANMNGVTTNQQIHAPPIQMVAEYFCAARLWHHKYTIQHLQQYSTMNNNYLLHWFMNVPPESLQQVQCIVQRMNYIIDKYCDGSGSSGNRPSGSTQKQHLPPFHPIPNEIFAMTPQQQQQSHATSSPPRSVDVQSFQPSSISGMQQFWDNATGNRVNKGNITGGTTSFLDTVAAAFTDVTSSTSASSTSDPIAKAISTFTETIAAKTHSLQKFIDTTTHATSPKKVSEQLQQNIVVLHHYVMTQQEFSATPVVENSALILHQQQKKQSPPVPNDVWVALANLQQIQQQLYYDGR